MVLFTLRQSNLNILTIDKFVIAYQTAHYFSYYYEGALESSEAKQCRLFAAELSKHIIAVFVIQSLAEHV